MNCKKMKRLISLYIDGEITPAREKELFNHLDRCDRCKKEKEFQEFFTALLVPPPEIQPGPGFVYKVKERITAPTLLDYLMDYYRESLSRFLKPALAAVACSLIFVLSFLLGNSLGSQLKETEKPPESSIVESIDNAMNFSVFDSIPKDSFAFAYFNLFQEKQK